MPNPNIPEMWKVFAAGAAPLQAAADRRQRAQESKQRQENLQYDRISKRMQEVQEQSNFMLQRKQAEDELQLRRDQFEEQKKVHADMQSAREAAIAAREKEMEYKENWNKIQNSMLDMRREMMQSQEAGSKVSVELKKAELLGKMDEVMERSVARRPGGPFAALTTSHDLMEEIRTTDRNIANITASGMINTPALEDARKYRAALEEEAKTRSNLMRQQDPTAPANELDQHVTNVNKAAASGVGEDQRDMDIRVKAAQDASQWMPKDGKPFEPNEDFFKFFQSAQAGLPQAQQNAYFNSLFTQIGGPEGPQKYKAWIQKRLSQGPSK